MSRYPWAALTPALPASIEAQPRVAHPGRYEHSDDRECGCHERDGGWWLCLYHDGFQDAEAIMLGMIERLAANHRPDGS